MSPVGIVTVTYRSTDEIGAFLDTVGRSQPRPAHVVVVDNRSEESEEILRLARAHGAKTVALADNRGYGAAVNVGVRELPDDVDAVVIANPDVRVEADTVSRLAAVLERSPDIGAVGPQVRNVDGSVYPSARQIPSLRTGVGHALFSRIWPRNPWTARYRQDDAPTDVSRDVGWLSGSFLLVRRSAFDAIGGFDDRYFMYFEDVDLGYRLGRAGWRNVYEPASVVTHIGAASTSTVRGEMLRIHHRSAYRFLAGKYRGWYLAPVRWTLHAGLALRARWLTRGLP
jgi:Predicted glycosyltransferases